MDKLNRLLAATPSQFAVAFNSLEDDSRAQAGQTTAAFWLEGGTTRAGAGFVWGHGEINYGGANHAFRLSGLSIADIDAASICANGSVMHLKRLSDFSGSYKAQIPGAGMPSADPVAYLKNERGVVMKLASTDASWRINLLVNGLRVRLKQSK
jgi:hypothetical protein